MPLGYVIGMIGYCGADLPSGDLDGQSLRLIAEPQAAPSEPVICATE
jgi:hypothetical protein